MLRVVEKHLEIKDTLVSSLILEELVETKGMIGSNRTLKRSLKVIEKSTVREFVFDCYALKGQQEMSSSLLGLIIPLLLVVVPVWFSKQIDFTIGFYEALMQSYGVVWVFLVMWLIIVFFWYNYFVIPKKKITMYEYVASILIEKGYLED